KPEAIGCEHRGGSADGLRREGTALENPAHDVIGNHNEGDKERRRKSKRERHRSILRMQGATWIIGREKPAHLRQQHGSRRYADDAERQLIDTVGIIDRGYAA